MKRGNFMLAALVAIATFATLSAFVHRPYGWHRGGYWRHERCYHDDRRPQDRSFRDRQAPANGNYNDSSANDDSVNTH
jgi:hypothetical protein